jgi:hypothetical protein
MDDSEATNLNFQLPNYSLPEELVHKIVVEFRRVREKKGIMASDISAYFTGSRDERVENLVRGAISKVLMHEKLSPYDEMECFNPANENAIILNILSFY